MKLNISNPTSSADLCKTCLRSHIYITETGDVTRTCTFLERDAYIPRVVVKCNRHNEDTGPSVYDMRQIAWVLRTDGSGKHIGFARYTDLPKKEREFIDNLD